MTYICNFTFRKYLTIDCIKTNNNNNKNQIALNTSTNAKCVIFHNLLSFHLLIQYTYYQNVSVIIGK